MQKSHSGRPRTGQFQKFLVLAGSEPIFTEITEYEFISLL